MNEYDRSNEQDRRSSNEGGGGDGGGRAPGAGRTTRDLPPRRATAPAFVAGQGGLPGAAGPDPFDFTFGGEASLADEEAAAAGEAAGAPVQAAAQPAAEEGGPEPLDLSSSGANQVGPMSLANQPAVASHAPVLASALPALAATSAGVTPSAAGASAAAEASAPAHDVAEATAAVSGAPGAVGSGDPHGAAAGGAVAGGAAAGGAAAGGAAAGGAAAGGAAGGAGGAAAEPGWVARARTFNRGNHAVVAQFNQATASALVVDGEVEPTKVARWQRDKQIRVDGRVGNQSLVAARGPATEAAPGGTPAGSAPAGATANAAPTTGAQASPGGGAAAGTAAGGGAALAGVGGGGPDLLDVARRLMAGAAELGEQVWDQLKAMGGAVADAVQAVVSGGQPAQAGADVTGGATAGDKKTPVEPGEPIRRVISSGSQQCLVFVSPGGLTTPTPDIFLFFHGHVADYDVDGDGKLKKGAKISGADVAQQAMTRARGKNMIAILPQGVTGTSTDKDGNRVGRSREGGYMADLQAGLPTFLTTVLGGLASELQLQPLTPGHISIAGHSAGGYQGVHDALSKAGDLMGQISDLTLMDSNYASAHFKDAARWMFVGGPGKALRIIGSAGQMEGKGKVHYSGLFAGKNLDALAAKAGCTVTHLQAGEVRDQGTKVMQHSHVLKDGQVQCDVLILKAAKERDHHQIRDDVMYDAIHSIGRGAEGSDDFARQESVDAGTAGGAGGGGTATVGGGGGGGGGGEIHAPLPEHGPAGYDETPEQVKVVPPTPSKSPGKEIYGKGGVLSRDNLTRSGLDDAEFDFKKRVYDAAVARLGNKIYGGVPEDELTSIGGKHKLRKEAAGPLESMLSAMRADITAGRAVDGKEVGHATGIMVSSSYRSPAHDFGLWDSYFQNYMVKTVDLRAATGDPYGAEAVKAMVKFIGSRKAPPGGSNHSNGIAVDLKIELDGKPQGGSYEDQSKWRSSYQYAWLNANAATYGFKNYPKEAWHWDYKP